MKTLESNAGTVLTNFQARVFNTLYIQIVLVPLCTDEVCVAKLPRFRHPACFSIEVADRHNSMYRPVTKFEHSLPLP